MAWGAQAAGVTLAALLGCGAVLADAPPVVVQGGIPQPLTALPGDSGRGEALVRDMSRASCLICHMAPLEGEPDMGDIGPSLAGVATRLNAAELRLRLVDARLDNPATVMPPYHAPTGLTRVASTFAGQPIYTAQEVEDVLAWLQTLKTP